MVQHDTPSACSCRLPSGHWGDGGWHFFRPTVDGLIRRELRIRAKTDHDLRRLIERDGRSLAPPEREQVDREMAAAREQSAAIAAAAAGRPWAYERCQEYLHAVERSIAARKADERHGRPEDQRWV